MKPVFVAFFMALCLAFSAVAQRPCRDTIVNQYDTICEGTSYDFNGRLLTYSGLFFDTLPRVVGGCDSVIMLHLRVMEYPMAQPMVRTQCKSPGGYLLSASQGEYFLWTSSPIDSSLVGQEHEMDIFVSPKVPTVYTLNVDWRESPMCPAHGTVSVHPISLVRAFMRVDLNNFTYDNLQVVAEDRSVGNREALYGGWCGRSWYLNGERQGVTAARCTFQVQPWMGDTIDLMLEAYSPDCVDTVVRRIPFPKGRLTFPNIFFPEQDANNLFIPLTYGLSQYELKIFDRYGVLVFQTDDVDTGWDGTCQGRNCKTGTYVYHCRYIDETTPNGYQHITGTVTLVR